MKPKKKIEQMTKWLQQNKRRAAGGLTGILVIIGLTAAGLFRFTQKDNHLEKVPKPVTQTAPPETEPPAPALDEDQKAVLDTIIRYLQEDNLEAAAAGLLENEQKLDYVFYQVLDGQQYLYKDGVLSDKLEGKGLVLKKPMAIYYGDLKGGKPNGKGIAVQGINLDGLRYDYSDGIWQDGLMNGAGVVGYHYYKGIQGEENQAIQKEGTFANDLMEGAFVYSTTNSEGEITTWNMEAASGKTKVDERWIHEEEKQDFYLPSNQDSAHAYVLPETATEEVRWRNMLPWNE